MLSAVAEAVLEPVFDFSIRLPGYFVLRPFSDPTRLELDNARVLFAGLLTWLTIAGTVALVVRLA
jgi:hypothetical protein